MDRNRRSIEVDEDVALALEERAMERGVTVSELVADLASAERVVTLLPEDITELDRRAEEWERDRQGYDAKEVFDWLRGRIERVDALEPRLRRF